MHLRSLGFIAFVAGILLSLLQNCSLLFHCSRTNASETRSGFSVMTDCSPQWPTGPPVLIIFYPWFLCIYFNALCILLLPGALNYLGRLGQSLVGRIHPANSSHYVIFSINLVVIKSFKWTRSGVEKLPHEDVNLQGLYEEQIGWMKSSVFKIDNLHSFRFA